MVTARHLARSAKWRLARATRPTLDRLGTALLAPPRTGFGTTRLHGPRDSRRIALTFDDGPSRPSTEDMLDVLAELNAPAAFFCVGEMVRWHEEVVHRAFTEGHVIGNHSSHHDRSRGLSPRGAAHIDETQAIIESVIGQRPALYRPPWGWLTPWEARRAERRGLHVVGWDVYPDDWKMPETPANVTAAQVCSRAQPGSIVLLHDATSNIEHCTKSQSAKAVKVIVHQLRDDGYEFVRVDELLNVQPYQSLPVKA